MTLRALFWFCKAGGETLNFCKVCTSWMYMFVTWVTIVAHCKQKPSSKFLKSCEDVIFYLRNLGYLLKPRHTAVSHQFKRNACRFWPFLAAWLSGPSSVWGLCPAWVHNTGCSLTQVLRRPNQITSTYLPQSTATGSPPRQGWNGNSNIQQPCRAKREDGGVWGQRGEREL